MASPIVIETHELSKRYGPQWAVSDLTLAIQKGTSVGIIGPNGSGKTTLLNLLTGVIRPTRGTYRWFGEPLSPTSARRCGCLIERPAFYPWLSARDNLAIVALNRGLPPQDLSRSLRAVGLDPRSSLSLQKFSLGMKQRLGLAAAFLGDPEVLILDEPTNGLDAEGMIHVRELVQERHRRGATILMTSHILSEIELLCTDVLVLQRGRLISQDPSLPSSDSSTGQTVIVGAVDPAGLIRLTTEWGLKTVVMGHELYLVSLPSDWTVASFNRRLVEAGVDLHHLVPKESTLEERFLKMIAASPAPENRQ